MITTNSLNMLDKIITNLFSFQHQKCETSDPTSYSSSSLTHFSSSAPSSLVPSSTQSTEPQSPRPRMTVSSQSGTPKISRPPDTDLITTATSALRRLHFKTGRNAVKSSPSKQQVNNDPILN